MGSLFFGASCETLGLVACLLPGTKAYPVVLMTGQTGSGTTYFSPMSPTLSLVCNLTLTITCLPLFLGANICTDCWGGMVGAGQVALHA